MSKQTEKLAQENLPGHVLLSLARNESASLEMRKAAVELMLDNGFKETNHPEVQWMLAEIKKARAAKDEVEAIVESQIEGPIQSSPSTPPTPVDSPVSAGTAYLTPDQLGVLRKNLFLPFAIDRAKEVEPSAADLDAIAEEDKAREATGGALKASVTTKDIL